MPAKSTDTFPAATPYMANGQKFLIAGFRLQAQACKAAMRYQIEMLDFLKHRYEKDVKFVDDLVARDELTDTFDVVTDFMQNAATEYAAEAGKIAGIGSRLSSDSARRVRRQAEEMVEDLAAKTAS